MAAYTDGLISFFCYPEFHQAKDFCEDNHLDVVFHYFTISNSSNVGLIFFCSKEEFHECMTFCVDNFFSFVAYSPIDTVHLAG